MINIYEEFIKAYNLRGKEKMEGIYILDYTAMAPQEYSAVEEILINDAMKLDTIAIVGLGKMKSKKAVKSLRSLLENVPPPSKIHLRIVEALWEITHDVIYQKLILEDFSEDDEDLRKQAAIVLEYTRPSQITFDAFKKMLMDEKESIMRMGAARGILIYYGLMKSANDDDGYKKNLQYIRLLKNSYDKHSLSAAIAEVEKEAARIKG